MSSGVEADIALDAAVIASLGLVRVMGGAAGLAAGGAGVLAALAEGRAEARAGQVRAAQRQEEAVRAVLDRNARIVALADSARRHGVEAALPAPHDLAEGSADELDAWCTQADAALDEAERSLAGTIAATTATRIFAAAPVTRVLPPPGDRPPAERRTDGPGEDPVAGTVARVLARLLPDADDGERRSVGEAAERVAGAPTGADAESLLTEVRIRVQNANARIRERRDGRAAAARFARELAEFAAAASLLPRLDEVAAGARPFDDDLRAEAVRLVAEVQREAEQRYVAAALRAAFEDLGYELDEGFETLTAHDGEAVLTRGDWTQHAVKVRVDDARQVRLALLRTEPAASDDQRRLDVEREEQWCASFDAARERLERAGIHSDVRWHVEPGEQRLPVVRGERPRPRARTRERER